MDMSHLFIFLIILFSSTPIYAAPPQLIYSLSGDAPVYWNGYGESVSALSDLNQDGYDEFAVGVPRNTLSSTSTQEYGSVLIYSGYNYDAPFYKGHVLREIASTDVNDRWFGASVAPLSDKNGDGKKELIIGSPFQAPYGFSNGTVKIVSPFNGALIHTIVSPNGPPYPDNFGSAVTETGDLNGDGVLDIAISAPSVNNSDGAVYIFSGSNYNLLSTLSGPTRSFFGSYLRPVSDISGDGKPDLIIGGRLFNNYSGSVSAFAIAPGLTNLWTILNGNNSSDNLGFFINQIPDINNDGKVEIAVGALQSNTKIYSGFNGSLLHVLNDDVCVASAGSDFDGDGKIDWIFGDMSYVDNPPHGNNLYIASSSTFLPLVYAGQGVPLIPSCDIQSGGNITGTGSLSLVIGSMSISGGSHYSPTRRVVVWSMNGGLSSKADEEYYRIGNNITIVQ